jgi:hypothetical protein
MSPNYNRMFKLKLFRKLLFRKKNSNNPSTKKRKLKAKPLLKVPNH